METESLIVPPSPPPVEPSGEPVVRIEGLVKRYQVGGPPVVADFDLDLARGEIAALLGPSGCGKTTLLRLIAGFDVPDAGRIVVAGREVSGPHRFVPPERRKLGFVFQDYALFPHLDVLHNVAFGLTGLRRRDRLTRARETLDLVGLTIFSRRFPHQLSGGQQQRVSLARALAPEPYVMLLDEPFSNLDAAQRGATREEVRRILARTGATTLLVTHDQEEAMSFADRIAIMRAGRLEQVGPPEEANLRPRTPFVASFLGTTNLIRGRGRGASAETSLGDLPLLRPAEGQLLLSVRPENLLFDHHRGTPVEVVHRAFKGHDLTYRCRLIDDDSGDEMVTVQTGPGCEVRVGERVRVRVEGEVVALER
jgi:iron(III) transport system ATP-binding protein